MDLKVKWKQTIRFKGLVPRVVTVPVTEPMNIIANGVLKVKAKFVLDKEDLLEYKLTYGELPKSVTIVYIPRMNDSYWRKISASWHSVYDKEITIKCD